MNFIKLVCVLFVCIILFDNVVFADFELYSMMKNGEMSNKLTTIENKIDIQNAYLKNINDNLALLKMQMDSWCVGG